MVLIECRLHYNGISHALDILEVYVQSNLWLCCLPLLSIITLFRRVAYCCMLCIACSVTILYGMVRSCLILLNSCKIALGRHFGSSACHLPLVASLSLGFSSIPQSPFNTRKLVRFMRIYSLGGTFIVLICFPRLHNHIISIVDVLKEQWT